MNTYVMSYDLIMQEQLQDKSNRYVKLTKSLVTGSWGSVILDSLFSNETTRPAALIPFWKLGAKAKACAADEAPNRRAWADLNINID